MKSPRETCPKRELCGATGHLLKDGRWQRCTCLSLEIAATRLREMYTPNPRTDTVLRKMTEQDLLIEGPLQVVRNHVAGALMTLNSGRRFMVMDAYRLLEIFLEKDEEHETSRPVVDTDLLVLLLGFGDPRNRYLPELVLQALSRRALLQKPTWCILGMDKGQIAHKYSAELATTLTRFKSINAK